MPKGGGNSGCGYIIRGVLDLASLFPAAFICRCTCVYFHEDACSSLNTCPDGGRVRPVCSHCGRLACAGPLETTELCNKVKTRDFCPRHTAMYTITVQLDHSKAGLDGKVGGGHRSIYHKEGSPSLRYTNFSCCMCSNTLL